MDANLTQPLTLLVAGAAAFGLAALLWALRISDGARGAARRHRQDSQKARALRPRRKRFSAHPGVIMVWEEDEAAQGRPARTHPRSRTPLRLRPVDAEWGAPASMVRPSR
ncbi:MAG: hypothetical protein R3C52_03045 [Hyphomonadaceae bacterium]